MGVRTRLTPRRTVPSEPAPARRVEPAVGTLVASDRMWQGRCRPLHSLPLIFGEPAMLKRYSLLAALVAVSAFMAGCSTAPKTETARADLREEARTALDK